MSYGTWGNPLNPYTGSQDIFIAKLNNSGESVWNTFMGSADSDISMAITLDTNGNVFVSGSSWGSWGNPVNDHSGDDDAFVAKLSSNGETVWNTFMGSENNDDSDAIAVDSEGNIYITGDSYDSWGDPLCPHAGLKDAFVVKLNNEGSIQWNTFIGSMDYDYGYDITVDRKGNIFVTGQSDLTWGNPINTFSGDEDAFVAKIIDRPLGPSIPVLVLNPSE